MARVLIASGGTGGHVFPSAVLAAQLEKAGVQVLVSGAALNKNPFIKDQGLKIKEITSRPGVKGLPYVAKGVYESLKVLKNFNPNLVVGFGSYTSFPLLLAAKLKKVPIMLWAADAYPGKVVRWFSPYAQLTATHFPEAVKHLKGRHVPCLMPLREGFSLEAHSKEESLAYFGLDASQPILLVVGGSQGAKFLNHTAPKAIGKLPPGVRVIHLAGSESEVEAVQKAYEGYGVKAIVKGFESKLHHAWRIADIALARAGAVSVREQLEFEVPGVLVPYPAAADNHQEENCRTLKQSGLAEMVVEKALDPDKLAKLLMSVLLSQSVRREKARRFKQGSKAKSLSELVMEYLHETA